MTYEALIPVQATKPAAPWMGGKHLLAKRLDNIISSINHNTYAEPFVGMGGVFFKRTARPKGEIINDLNGDIINLFRILREHYPQFMDCLKFQITSRDEFERLRKLDGGALTDLQRAARFLYLQRNGFGGKFGSRSFGTAVRRMGRFDVNKLAPMLADIHERLSGVTLECLSYETFITKYDRPDTLFYLDPPYHGCENDYGKGLFSKDDFEIMADLLTNLQGKFVMSINNTPMIRDLFGHFTIQEAETAYSIGKKNGSAKKVTELIISKA